MDKIVIDTCIYFHIVKNQIIYVGIGNAKRPYSKGCRSKQWNEIIKNGYDVDIYKTGLTWKEACQLEIEWIAKIGRKDKELGPLVNMTDGGDGIYNLSKESKDKIREKLKNNKNGLNHIVSKEARLAISIKNKGNKSRKGQTNTEEHNRKNSLAQKGKLRFHKTTKGYKASKETRKKLSEAHKGKPWSDIRRNAFNKNKLAINNG